MSEDKKKILLVDDDPEWLEFLQGILSHSHHRFHIQVANNGREALGILPGVDLVITDLEMPDIDGLTLLKKIRETRPGLPVILQTGGEWEGGVQGKILKKWGMTGFLFKHEVSEKLWPMILEALGVS